MILNSISYIFRLLGDIVKIAIGGRYFSEPIFSHSLVMRKYFTFSCKM